MLVPWPLLPPIPGHRGGGQLLPAAPGAGWEKRRRRERQSKRAHKCALDTGGKMERGEEEMGRNVFGTLKLLPLFCCFADSYKNT